MELEERIQSLSQKKDKETVQLGQEQLAQFEQKVKQM